MSMQGELFDKGLEIRKAVIGEDYVERALANANTFNWPLQELLTEWCWGAVWGREELDRRTRSLINIAMITALGRQAELALHVRGAIRNGATVEEIREVLLQAAVYCGAPAAVEAFRTASQALAELGITFDPVS